jgi:hypothetical protein
MKPLLLIFTSITLIFFISCGKKQEEKPAPADSLHTDSLTVKPKETQANVNAPAWFKNPPSADNVLYAGGEAHSGSPTIAREKAIMNARVALAEMLKKEKSGSEPDSLNAYLRMSHITKEKSVKKGKRWQHFVLMEMPKH